MRRLVIFLLLVFSSTSFALDGTQLYDQYGNIVSPGITRPTNRWPVVHLNAGSAARTQLLTAPSNTRSHYVTGFLVSGGANGDGFYFLRQDCLEFGGSNNTWTVSDVAELQFDNGDYSIEIWYQNNLSTPTQAGLLSKDDGDDGYILSVNSDGTVKFQHQDGSNTVSVTSTSSTTTEDAWYYIAVTCDRDGDLAIYINGTAENTTDVSSATGQCDGTGTDLTSTGTGNGNIYLSAVGIYKGTVLSSSTITTNYNSGIGHKYEGNESNLSLAWNNDEGSGTTCYEVTAAVSNATLSNTAWSPYKQAYATAEVNISGVPIDTTDMKQAVGKFHCGYQTGTAGGFSGLAITFPHAIKIGRHCPLSILETDGDFSLIVFGFTDELRE